MNIAKTILTLGLASLVMPSVATPVGGSAGVEARKNPLLVSNKLPFGAPDFKNIRTSDYLPAIQAGIDEAPGTRCASCVTGGGPPLHPRPQFPHPQSRSSHRCPAQL